MSTIYLPAVLPEDVATYYYQALRDTISWDDGIFSKRYKGPTRKAHQYTSQSPARELLEELAQILSPIIMKELNDQPYQTLDVLGCYLNYYVNGEMFTPSHTHPGQHQIILSLGATRTLNISNRKYALQNGDLIVFGSQSHGVPKEPEVQDGRISIAIFTIMK